MANNQATKEKKKGTKPIYRALSASEEEIQENIEIIRDNQAGQPLSDRDLGRVTIPPQGMTKWVISGVGGDQYVDAIEGVVVHIGTPRAYWSKSMEEDGRTPPDCSSPDGITGIAAPGGGVDWTTRKCIDCPFNVFGTSRTGSQTGKACKEQRLLYVLRPENFLPMVVQVPVTSIPAVTKYVTQLSTIPKSYKRVHTSLTLEKVDGPPPYSRIVVQLAGDVDKETAPKLKQYVDNVTPLLAAPQYQPEPIRMEAVEKAKQDALVAAGEAAQEQAQDSAPTEGAASRDNVPPAENQEPKAPAPEASDSTPVQESMLGTEDGEPTQQELREMEEAGAAPANS